MYKLKSIVRRSSLLGSAIALVAAAVLPASMTFADALNPLTERSLTLSSSSPGWDYKDGSGNTTYAPPNSGANGQKTGNTFSFKVSTDSSAGDTIKGITFQYCTLAAGLCTAPGNDGFTGTSPSETRNADDDATGNTDLAIHSSTPTEISTAFSSIIDASTGDATSIPLADDSQGNFVVMTEDAGDTSWTQNTGWTMAVTNNEDTNSIGTGTATGADNFITLTNSGGGLGLHTGGAVKVIFFGTNSNYVTNPGAGAFFVKINDYNSDTTLDGTTLQDGGVTVANVVNQSIEIQTKVLETMDFSVGTVDPDTLSDAQLTASTLGETTHGQCDSILPGMTAASILAGGANTLLMGDQSAENSLSTSKTFSTHSYWRLSSNSSAGATVYYSGETLSNTEGDQIAAIGTTATAPHVGTPQFGLALDNGTGSTYAVNYGVEETGPDYIFENGADATANTQGIDASTTTDTAGFLDYHAPSLTPMAPEAQYAGGTGNINTHYGSISTTFAFDPNSNVAPVPIASDAGHVVDCVTAKVRYIANIAATTPAGIYTTKVNYIAAPEY